MRQQMTYDADTGLAFVESQLSYIESKMWEVQYRKITYNQVIPISTEPGEWAQSVVYYFSDRKGKAKFIGSKALDVPLVEVGTERAVTPVELAGIGYDYSDEEIRQAIYLGQPLPQRKANAARECYEDLTQRTGYFGDLTLNLPGFLNNANVPSSVVVNPGAGTEWVNKTPDEITFDINDFLGDIFVDTLQIEQADTLLLPTQQWNYIATTRLDIVNNTTILEYIVSKSPYLNSTADVIPIPELVGAGVGGSDRMVAYTKSTDKVVYYITMPLRFTEPQREGLGFIVPGAFKIGGVEFRYPLSARYADGI
jgi:hypothetical protein